MSRAFLIVMDSAGCGGAPDAAAFGDEAANTLAHIAQACARGAANEGREGPLRLPFLDGLGLGAAIELASRVQAPGLDAQPRGLWGAATEISLGKDTPSGHWELAGVPVPWAWHLFPETMPAFPAALVGHICRLSGTDGILGNRHASGTEILAKEGGAHLQTGWPICYTSADSVVQIAAHEEAFGLERLYRLCADLAPIVHEMKVGRVIARPFIGDVSDGFVRTKNRRDYTRPPPGHTLLDDVQAAGREVWAIGKIADIFAGRGITHVLKGTDAELMRHLQDAVTSAPAGSLTFANFVEFDSLYGHRRDVAGYARALEWFDASIEKVSRNLRKDDLLLITADHGNDPTWRGTDHTRERVPVIGCLGETSKAIGLRMFGDVGVSVAAHLGVASRGQGESFL